MVFARFYLFELYWDSVLLYFSRHFLFCESSEGLR
ncbi:MAG: hypothetical protein KatS3mg107_1176 [Gemmataceae bacterium]|nr:MAG: hypothetical protein KatS3mg107_1176 [Gemmataceae bacterium]